MYGGGGAGGGFNPPGGSPCPPTGAPYPPAGSPYPIEGISAAPYPAAGEPYPPAGGQQLPYSLQPGGAGGHFGPGGPAGRPDFQYPPVAGIPEQQPSYSSHGMPGFQPQPSSATAGYPGSGGGGFPLQGSNSAPYPGEGVQYPLPGGVLEQQPSYPPQGTPEFPPQPSAGTAGYPGGSCGGFPAQGSQPTTYPGASYPGCSGTKRISVRVQCSDLVSKDLFSKSDPMCVLSAKQGGSGAWAEVGRTEVIKNNHHPTWAKKFVLDYIPGARQEVRFEVYDSDNSSRRDLRSQDFLGRSLATLDEIVVDHGRHYRAPLRDGPSKQKKAQISANVEMLSTVEMQLAGQNLKDLDTFSRSDPFFCILKKTPHGRFERVYSGEKVDNDLNPQWKPFSLLDSQLCDGDHNMPLVISVYDWDGGGSHDLIGQCETSLAVLKTQHERGGQLQLVNPKKRGKQMGFIIVKKLQIV